MGVTRQVEARHGLARRGLARQGWDRGSARHGGAWRCVAGQGLAGQGKVTNNYFFDTLKKERNHETVPDHNYRINPTSDAQ